MRQMLQYLSIRLITGDESHKKNRLIIKTFPNDDTCQKPTRLITNEQPAGSNPADNPPSIRCKIIINLPQISHKPNTRNILIACINIRG